MMNMRKNYEDEDAYDEEQDERIREIFGDREMKVARENLGIYLEYLKQNVKFPCQLRGTEDFDWEEFYTSNLGNKHKQLHKGRPSPRDTFKLISFNQDLDEDQGILVNIQRGDRKRFTAPLIALEAIHEESKNYELFS